MALTNSQYDHFMRIYGQRQSDNNNRLRTHYEEACRLLPRLKEIDDTISAISLKQARKLLDGDTHALAALKTELQLLFTEKKELLASSQLPPDYLEPLYTCPDCKDTGFADGHKCHCFQKAIIDFLYSQSNLKEILEKENFASCSLEYYSHHHIDPLTGRSSYEAMQTALKSCHSFVDTFSTEFHNILLYGDTGIGKTFLSHCIAKELIERSFSVLYFTASTLFTIFAKHTFDKDTEASETYEHIYSCDLLLIDDLGTEFSNSFTVSQLFICLNERILRQKSTIISTNLALEDLKNVYSERIFSRITSSYTVLRLTGDDIRIQKKLMNKR